MPNEIASDADAIIDAVERLAGFQLLTVKRGTADECPVAVVPEGKELVSLKPLLDAYLERPRRKTGTTMLTTVESFCDYVNRHKSANTVVFVDDVIASEPSLVAVFNAHDSNADYQDHRAEYRFPMSDEWRAWTRVPKEFSQAEFAHFLEDRITDVIDAASAGDTIKAFATELGVHLGSAARLLELSRGLTVHVDAKVSQVVNLSSGEVSMAFSEEHKDGNNFTPLKVPGAFAIAIPVFRLGPRYQIPVRLRYRVKEARVCWTLCPQRLDRVLEHAIDEAAQKVAHATQCPLFRGRVLTEK